MSLDQKPPLPKPEQGKPDSVVAIASPLISLESSGGQIRFKLLGVDLVDALVAAGSCIENAFAPLGALEEWLKDAAPKIAEFAGNMHALVEQMSAAERIVVGGLVEYSWYLDPKMVGHTVFSLTPLILNEDERSIDEVMSEHFRQDIARIESDLNSYQPGRAPVLKEALAAHREGKYALSVPVFLAQADGISRELIGAEFFTYRQSAAPTQELLRGVADDAFLTAALRALVPKGAIRESSGTRKRGLLNRHAILHGEDPSYATEINSLKAVSLLNFMNAMNVLKLEFLAKKLARPSPSKKG